jgi:nucleoid-associated protein YgaU
MNPRLGLSCAWSFLIVVVVAVALYRPDPPQGTARPAASAVPRSSGVATGPEPAPAPREVIAGRVADAPAGPAPRRPARRPSGAFTRVAAGESLAEVALRVYGTAEAARTIWQANRDQLDRPDAPLGAGTVLRTP